MTTAPHQPKKFLLAAVIAAALCAPGVAAPTPPAATVAPAPAARPTADLVAIARKAGNFNTLVRALDAAGLSDSLKSGSFVTLFAPTDAAFAALPPGTLDRLMQPANRAELRALLANHVVPGYATAEFLASQPNAAMNSLGDRPVIITSHGGVTVSGAKLVAADVRASNGLIHSIDRVILPSGADATASTGQAPEGSTPD